MNNAIRNTSGLDGLATKIKKTLASLLDSSKQLQSAIIKRDVNSIWQILADQQTRLNEFEQYNYLWGQLISSGADSPNIARLKDEINSDIKMVRNTGNNNATLIRSFLSAIRKALKQTGTDLATKTKVYGKKGKMTLKQSSLLINSAG
jgi:hypothetical protein